MEDHPPPRRPLPAPRRRSVEFYRAGPYPHDGMRIHVYDADGASATGPAVRASGTEAVLRAYMEIVEPSIHRTRCASRTSSSRCSTIWV